MPHTIQEFFAAATQKAANDLKAALLRLPEDKRGWSPADTARSALDQVAECALMNAYGADIITERKWLDDIFTHFSAEKNALMQEETKLLAVLEENTQKAMTVIRAVPDVALDTVIELPWEKITLAESLAYPYWNMAYHEGQINYIASMLGLLK